MKRQVPRFLFSVLLPLALFHATNSRAEDLVPSREARLSRGCNCDSGNGLVSPSSCGSGYSRTVQKMYNENRGQMISCCRPRAVQDYLIRCFTACGQPGRAVKNSRHVTGHACDTTSTTVGHRYGLQYIPHDGSNHWQE